MSGHERRSPSTLCISHVCGRQVTAASWSSSSPPPIPPASFLTMHRPISFPRAQLEEYSGAEVSSAPDLATHQPHPILTSSRTHPTFQTRSVDRGHRLLPGVRRWTCIHLSLPSFPFPWWSMYAIRARNEARECRPTQVSKPPCYERMADAHTESVRVPATPHSRGVQETYTRFERCSECDPSARWNGAISNHGRLRMKVLPIGGASGSPMSIGMQLATFKFIGPH